MGEANAQLATYYRRVFPFKPFTKWLCYGQKPCEYFSRRELAFILEDDVHLRYRSFTDQSEFEKELCRMSPEKLDVGAVYNYRPSERQRHSDFRATERELVFDIDLTDYDDVRTCCNDARVCTKCWRFVALAVKVLDHLIENEFGFMSRMWVFSGRRGVHCWVADEKARKLSAGGRTAIAEHLSLVQGTKIEPGKSKRNRVFVHPVFDTAYQMMINSPEFEKLVVEQGWLTDERLPKVLLLHSDESLRDEIFEKMKLLPEDSAARLKLLRRYFDPEARKEYKANQLPRVSQAFRPTLIQYDSNNPDTTAFLKKFVLYYAYPRLDVNVSTGLNHLLKSPFCVHPKTGCVAVPLEVETVEKFNPLEAPTIGKLNAEIVAVKEETKENRKINGFKHTSLAPYVATFEKFVDKVAK